MEDATADAPASGPLQFSALAFTVLPLFYLSFNFFGVLFHPLAPGNLAWIRDGMLIIWMEFILAHAGIFALNFFSGGIHWRTTPGMLLFVLFYGMFIAAFGFAFDRASMVVAMGALLFGRLYAVAVADESAMTRLFTKAFLTMGTYMACLFVCTVFYHGWNTPTNRALAHLMGERRANPFYGQAVAACAIYFLALALLEIKLYYWPLKLKLSSEPE